MTNQQELDNIKSFIGCGELSISEREELQRLRKENIEKAQPFQPLTMQPFNCNFCHKPTLQVCRDTRKPNTNNANLVACCKECKDIQNGDKPYLAVSSIYN